MGIDPETTKTIEGALDDLLRIEQLLGKVDRVLLLDIIDLFTKIDFKRLREAVEYLQSAELDMRMARLRIQANTGLQPPSLLAKADRTPVEPIEARRRSSASLRVDPNIKKR